MKVIASYAGKGGVGKTTTAVNLAAALALHGLKVLVVDLDPQGNASTALGVDHRSGVPSTYELLIGEATLDEAMAQSPHSPNLFCVPATIDLAGAEALLLMRPGREYALKRALAEVAEDFDVILIDCPPSLGVLTLNGLTAADEVIVPLQCETLAHRGVGQLLRTVNEVQQITNPNLTMLGAVATLFDARTTHSRDVLSDVSDRYDLPVIEPPIPRTVRFAEASASGASVMRGRKNKGATAYRDLAENLWKHWEAGEDVRTFDPS